MILDLGAFRALTLAGPGPSTPRLARACAEDMNGCFKLFFRRASLPNNEDMLEIEC
jgi:hypothetical protein